jgi:hypothetical protein
MTAISHFIVMMQIEAHGFESRIAYGEVKTSSEDSSTVRLMARLIIHSRKQLRRLMLRSQGSHSLS